MTSFLRACAACCATTLFLTACSGGGGSAAPTVIDPLPPAALHAEPIAGKPVVPGDDANGSLDTVRFNMPVDTRPTSHLAVDKAGNLYVTDKNQVIRKITPAGDVTTLAGTPGKPGTVDGTGSAASFNSVLGMVADTSGNVYVSDSSAVRKISPAGVVTTLAGKVNAPGNRDGQGGQAAFGIVTGGLAADPAGNLYLADTANNAIRRVSPSGAVTTLKLAVPLDAPGAVALDTNGNLTVAEPFRALRFAPSGELIQQITSARPGWVIDGPAGQASFGYIQSIAYSPAGLLYVIDRDAMTIAIRTVDADGKVATLRAGTATFGSNDGPIGNALFGSAFAGNNGMAFDAAGNLFLADLGNSLIRKISPGLLVSTYAGRPTAPTTFADGTGADAAFHVIKGFARDKAGNYYAADAGNCAIRKITPARVVTTLAGAGGHCGHLDGTGPAARFADIMAMTQDQDGNLYVAERTTVRKVTPAGVVTTIAGTPGTLEKVDGMGQAAAFYNLQGIAMSVNGNLLASDGGQYGGEFQCSADHPSSNNTLRTITPQGEVSTLPGTEWACQGSPTPLSVAGDLKLDKDGNLYLVSESFLAKRSVTGAAAYLLDNQGNKFPPHQGLEGHGDMWLAPDDAGNVFFTRGGEVYKYGPDRVVAKVVGLPGAGNATAITPDLPVKRITALAYIGNHQFLASFDDQVVMLTLK